VKLHQDPILKRVIDDIVGRYSDQIIAIYGIGSYFDDSLPPNWVKNDLDIIVIVKSLDAIPKKEWTEIRFKKKKIDRHHLWLGFNTIKAYRDNHTFSKQSVSNYEWSLIDIKHPENSKLLHGPDIRDQLPSTDNLIFNHDDILARGMYHLDKSLGEKETLEAIKHFSKAVFKTGFYFCILLDKHYRRASILEIGNKLKQLRADNIFLEKLIVFYEETIVYRITGSFITEFIALRDDFMAFLFSSLEMGALHRRMNPQELTQYLTDTFSGFSNIIQRGKHLKILN
jgi:hypothetical protein